MSKPKEKGLRLMVKPPARHTPRIPFGKWPYRWATRDEIVEYRKEGYILLKEL